MNTRRTISILVTLFVILGVFAVAISNKPTTDTTKVADQSGVTNPNQPTDTQGTVSNSVPYKYRNGEDEGEGGEDDYPVKAQVTPPIDTTKQTVSSYKDGTYSATGNYDSPGGPDSLKVTLTIKSGVVTSSSVVMYPGDRRSAKYMQMFESGYQAQVVGKNLGSIYLSYVSGSSLTPIGFNDALNKIKSQAKA